MFELSVETRFTASHAVTVGGVPEEPHSHVWHVTATVAGDALDDEGLLCDFHEIERSLKGIGGAFEERFINDVAPFNDGVPASTELIAKHIGDRLAEGLAPNVRLVSVRLTEAPGCAATYRP
jgi:6-pyruvoyltetrahydropterin/6-carboxytetrahydropterin synthase